jgi:hypothetical protein
MGQFSQVISVARRLVPRAVTVALMSLIWITTACEDTEKRDAERLVISLVATQDDLHVFRRNTDAQAQDFGSWASYLAFTGLEGNPLQKATQCAGDFFSKSRAVRIYSDFYGSLALNSSALQAERSDLQTALKQEVDLFEKTNQLCEGLRQALFAHEAHYSPRFNALATLLKSYSGTPFDVSPRVRELRIKHGIDDKEIAAGVNAELGRFNVFYDSALKAYAAKQ